MSADRIQTVWVDDVLRELRPSAYAIGLVALCVLVGLMEGYDMQAMAFAAPLLKARWSLTPGGIGALLSISVVGLVLGNFILSPLGDLWGRRPSILAALAVAAAATSAGAIAPDFGWLMATRLVAGLGLGLALPNVVALAMEYMPPRFHVISVVLVSCGYPLGAGLGGAIVGAMLAQRSVAVVFLAGGLGTLAVLALCAAFLAESPLLLARRPRASEKLSRLLIRLGGAIPGGEIRFALRESSTTHSPVPELFVPERRAATVLLWLMNFANLSLVYYFVSWLPSLFVIRGLSPNLAITAASVFSASGMVGGLAMAWVMPRSGPTRLLSAAYGLAVAATLVLSGLARVDAVFFGILALAGATIIGAQLCLNAVVNEYYPSAIRSTASGFATGAGRLGAIAGPLSGAVVLSLDASAKYAFTIAAAPAIVALIAVVALHRGALLAGPAAIVRS